MKSSLSIEAFLTFLVQLPSKKTQKTSSRDPKILHKSAHVFPQSMEKILLRRSLLIKEETISGFCSRFFLAFATIQFITVKIFIFPARQERWKLWKIPNRRKRLMMARKWDLRVFFVFNYSYIDFLCNMLDTTQSLSDDVSSDSSASNSPAPCNQFQNGSTGSPIVANEKLSYLFNVWRMDSEWGSSTGKIE